MSPELIAIVSVGVVLAGVILTGQRAIYADLTARRQDIAALRERMAYLVGLLEGLREAITRERSLEPTAMLCSRPSFLRKQESRPPAPRPLDAGSRPA